MVIAQCVHQRPLGLEQPALGVEHIQEPKLTLPIPFMCGSERLLHRRHHFASQRRDALVRPNERRVGF